MQSFFKIFKKLKGNKTKQKEIVRSNDKSIFSISKIACSKIIHDISGSIGSASNSLEMLKDSNSEEEKQELMYLMENSMASLRSRITIFRLAFDLSTVDKDIKEVQDAIKEYSSSLSNVLNIEVISSKKNITRNIYCIASCLFFYLAESFKTIETMDLNLEDNIIATVEGSFDRKKITEIKNINKLNKERFSFYFAKKIAEENCEIKIKFITNSKIIFSIHKISKSQTI